MEMGAAMKKVNIFHPLSLPKSILTPIEAIISEKREVP
jgi:hypothetical protein